MSKADEFFDYAEKGPKFSGKKALSFKKAKGLKKSFKKEGLRF